MSQNQASAETADRSESPASEEGPVSADVDETTLSNRVTTLEAENERLREAVSTAHRRRYQFTALGFAIIGTIAVGGGVVFPGERTVLLALGGTGIFGAVLTYFLTPERFVAAAIGERIYRTLADNEAAIADDLALEGQPTVLPADGSAEPARLFVSVAAETPPPETAELRVPFVTGEAPGLSVEPTGVGLYEELTDAAPSLPGSPAALGRTVGDALVEQFELIDAVEIDAETDRVTMALDGSAYGPVDRFDHPVASVLATTLAVELDCPVRVSVKAGDRADWLVTCRFDRDDDTASPSDSDGNR